MSLRKIAGNALLLLASLLVVLLLAELVLRVTGYEYKPLKLAVGNPDQRGTHMFEEDQFVYDPNLIWRPRPGYSVFNAQGFRGPELAKPKPADERRLFTVGDSNTLGWAGERGSHWPASLQGELDHVDSGYRVVNAGVWGYTSYQGIHRLRETLDYEPDWILISFGSNDAHPVSVTDEAFLAGAGWGRTFTGWLEKLAVGRLVLGGLRLAQGVAEADTHRVPLEDYRRNLRTMVSLARGAGAQVALMTRPYMGPIPAQNRWKNHAHLYSAAAVEIAEELDLPVVDLYAEFKGRDALFADESHFTDEGHARAGRIVMERLGPLLLESNG